MPSKHSDGVRCNCTSFTSHENKLKIHVPANQIVVPMDKTAQAVTLIAELQRQGLRFSAQCDTCWTITLE